MTRLRGMTWDHPRGIDPLRAHAAFWRQARGVEVEWDARPLADFEAYPLTELAERYDLIVIDHPHVGAAATTGCLLALESCGRGVELSAMTGATVGRSFESYFYDGRQWALAIDAAAQVAARRADAGFDWPADWQEVLSLAAGGRVACPLAPVHALMSFYSRCANLGHPCAAGDRFAEPDVGGQALTELRALAARVDPRCLRATPIDVLEWMSGENSTVAYAPLVYGYVSYARDGFRACRIEFADMPGVSGSTLGGTGIAVSARSARRDAALAVAFDLASPDTQRGLYAGAGQPAHRAAWLSAEVNAPVHGFYANTLQTLEAAYTRPRFDGYIAFQAAAGRIVVECLNGSVSTHSAVAQMNDLFQRSLP